MIMYAKMVLGEHVRGCWFRKASIAKRLVLAYQGLWINHSRSCSLNAAEESMRKEVAPCRNASNQNSNDNNKNNTKSESNNNNGNSSNSNHNNSSSSNNNLTTAYALPAPFNYPEIRPT